MPCAPGCRCERARDSVRLQSGHPPARYRSVVPKRPQSPHSRLVRPIVIWAALLVLCLGLPHQLVLCTGPHCHGTIEFVHASGSCCAAHHERSVDPPAQRATAAGSHRGCCGAHAGDHLLGNACDGDQRDGDDRDGDDRDGDERDGDALSPDRHGCHDVPLALDEGPLPERLELAIDLALLPPAPWPAVQLAPHDDAALLPPTTGPPRPRRQLACRRTTVLQL